MVDIKRRRQRPLALGMGAVSDVDKPEALRAVLGQLQENIEALWRRINEMAVAVEEEDALPEVEEPPAQEVSPRDVEALIIDDIIRRVALREVKVQTVKNDYLECLFWDAVGEETGVCVNVAKPHILRPSIYNNQTITYINGDVITYSFETQRKRSATDGEINEIQITTPDYWVGEILLAAPFHTGLTDDESKSIRWVDITSGRSWAREP